jgi:hypothetical protein
VKTGIGKLQLLYEYLHTLGEETRAYTYVRIQLQDASWKLELAQNHTKVKKNIKFEGNRGDNAIRGRWIGLAEAQERAQGEKWWKHSGIGGEKIQVRQCGRKRAL